MVDTNYMVAALLRMLIKELSEPFLDEEKRQLYIIDFKNCFSETLSKLSEEEISKVNNIIWQEETKQYSYNKKRMFGFKNVLLTSGNGFVDKLMLLSIVATELMIGIIVLCKLGGKL